MARDLHISRSDCGIIFGRRINDDDPGLVQGSTHAIQGAHPSNGMIEHK